MTELASERIDTSDMKALHNVFRSSLASGPQFVASAEGDDDRRRLIANYYVNVLDLLEVHHESEDELLFPLLIERAPDHAALIEEVNSQHEGVVVPMKELQRCVSDWEVEGDASAAALLRVMDDLARALSPHLDQEEVDILPLVGEHFSAQEWGRLPEHGMMNFKGDKPWLIVGLIRENFTQEQRDSMLEHMPPPARAMWESVGEGAYNALIAEIRQSDN